MRRAARRHVLFWSAAGLGTAIDQVAKSLVQVWFPEHGDEAVPVIPWVVGIRRHRNFGALGGLGAGHPTLLILVSFAAMGVIVWLFLSAKPRRRLTDLALGLMMAGAIGNVIDRLLLGHVRDFVKFLFWPQYPVFNLADAWLTIGVALMLMALIFGHKSQPAPETVHPS